MLDDALHLQVQLLDVSVELGMALEDFSLVGLVAFLGEEE